MRTASSGKSSEPDKKAANVGGLAFTYMQDELDSGALQQWRHLIGKTQQMASKHQLYRITSADFAVQRSHGNLHLAGQVNVGAMLRGPGYAYCLA